MFIDPDICLKKKKDKPCKTAKSVLVTRGEKRAGKFSPALSF